MSAEALGVRTSALGDSIGEAVGDAALSAWSCRAPSLAPDRGAVAYVSDRDGVPRVWIRQLRRGGRARPVATGPEPVAEVSWSPSGERLAVLLTPGGGEHTQVWTVRPDGGDLRPLAAPEGGSAWFVRWTGRGDLLLAAEVAASGTAEALLVDAATGGRETVARGPLLHPEAVSRDHARVLLRRGPRGVRRMYVRELTPEATGPGGERPLLADLPGSTDYGVLSPGGETAYLLSDAGRDRAALLAVAGDGRPVVLAERPDAELDMFALTADGRRVVLVWNAAGRSELEVLDTPEALETPDRAGNPVRRPLPPPPGEVVTSIRVSRDDRAAVLTVEGPAQPPHVVLCDLDTGRYRRVAGAGRIAGAVDAELVRFPARDGLELSGWLYRPPGAVGPAPYAVFLHGGPEDQERPTFNPLYQSLLAAGIGVLAPNVRGSAGFGRAFREADDHALRFRAIDDVADCAAFLVRAGLADAARLACLGWSYGGYLTLAALVTYPGLFRAGVDVCGMADFATFYERTEPWIAAAAVSEYGHPEADRDLLHALSPLHAFDRLATPLLVVHGARDTNVPVYEAEQVVRAARARGVPCEVLLFEDEGHQIRRRANRVTFVRRVTDWLDRHLTGVFPR
ncbi:S9 family peptidase [Microbispora amethystogenes]|uniref:Peptidase S9 n=1 Tax=Microbispora amethystogenes TaxID=1427754 RepID=A0ABQ4FIJ7_9ACTN|nr:S9 family peptidase [Microbispora amethystogenes]GIH34647.1 peptidase S9 [Microbispora amethystogenes]